MIYFLTEEKECCPLKEAVIADWDMRLSQQLQYHHMNI
jgi:hypothetical protein